MPREKGTVKTGGRQIGTVNKLTTSMKECTQQTLEWLQTQPRSNMREWAAENPTEFYRIAAKLIPTQVNAEVTQKVIKVVRADRGNGISIITDTSS
jgi:hypothetical protein